MRNSLRLFGLLSVLVGVNIYVFFFNHGTAPREVLKPSSLVKRENFRDGSGLAATFPAAAIEADPLPCCTASSTGAGVSGYGAVGATARIVHGGDRLQGEPVPKGDPGGNPGTAQAEPPDPERIIVASDTLGQILAREGFGNQASRVSAALSRWFDPRLIRGGQSYRVRRDERGEIMAFEFRPSPVTRFSILRGSSGATWIATRVDHELETRVVSATGAIDSSLYESIQDAGEGSALAGMLVDLLAWDVNFYSDTHPGDYWKVSVEKQFLEGQFFRYGHILAAEYGGQVGTFRAFYWKPTDRPLGPGAYYDEKGQAISKTLLKTPLRYVRVSSRFDRHRFHPILHREKAHLGIDYAAPAGTPVWASAGGKVVECQMKSGSGNTVVIAHANGLATRYYHLRRFASGLRAGQSVRQKQIIGFVGTTGLSTGPHLHFSVTKDGAFVDPSKVKLDRDAPVAERAQYLAAIRTRMAELGTMSPPVFAHN